MLHGRAGVRVTFKVGRVGTVVGCFVTEGTIGRSAEVRVVRDCAVDSARPAAVLEAVGRFRNDVRGMRAGCECGITITYYPLREGCTWCPPPWARQPPWLSIGPRNSTRGAGTGGR